MPTTVISQSSARTVPKVATHKPRAATASAKKRRLVRRRGRGRGELDSDEEIEREAATDSDSDDDDLSSLDSVTDDSDTEPASEDVISHDRAHLPTPRNSKSPESMVEGETRKMNGGVASFFAPTGDWSEMVTDEKDNGPADLPVIDFTDFNGTSPPQNLLARKSKKSNKPKRSSEARATPTQPPVATTPPVEEVEPSATEPEPKVLPSQLSKGQSARQAYQHKLETDPSFVPTIGNFWGHDDRLIDTELRSLSGWWRGRGRGRGRGFPMRGRGGFQGHPHSRALEDATSPQEAILPPIERAWTHDGFEDMKRKEEQRRAEHLAGRNDTSSPKRTGFNRGGFSRGRVGFMRGGFSSPIKARTVSPFAHSARVRFVMKPELMWTKQHEAFLYFDPTLKPRPGHGASYRVKTPGEQAHVVKASPTPRAAPEASTSKSEEGSDAGDKYFVVRLPQRVGKERAVVVVDEQSAVTPVKEVFSPPEPQPAVAKPSALLEQTPQPVTVNVSAPPPPPPTSEAPAKALSETSTRSQLERLSVDPHPSDPERLAMTEQAVLRQSTTEAALDPGVVGTSSSERPTLPPLQTTFTPPPLLPQPISQPSPAYGSPYGYHHALPVGVAMNHHGMPYEVATGRPVYFPPPPMYNPRPLMPNHYNAGVFVPGHAHHSSAVSSDFLAHPPSHTPPVNGFIDPATGTPIFSFPRQTSRIEIRAPAEDSGRSDKSAPRTSSGLRTTAPTFQPSRSTSTDNGYYLPTASDSSISSYDSTNGQPMEDAGHAGMAGMMAYPAYQQPYYYPEPYGYPQYMDMSQAGQYDMYNMEQTPQGTVYY